MKLILNFLKEKKMYTVYAYTSTYCNKYFYKSLMECKPSSVTEEKTTTFVGHYKTILSRFGRNSKTNEAPR